MDRLEKLWFYWGVSDIWNKIFFSFSSHQNEEKKDGHGCEYGISFFFRCDEIEWKKYFRSNRSHFRYESLNFVSFSMLDNRRHLFHFNIFSLEFLLFFFLFGFAIQASLWNIIVNKNVYTQSARIIYVWNIMSTWIHTCLTGVLGYLRCVQLQNWFLIQKMFNKNFVVSIFLM